MTVLLVTVAIVTVVTVVMVTVVTVVMVTVVSVLKVTIVIVTVVRMTLVTIVVVTVVIMPYFRKNNLTPQKPMRFLRAAFCDLAMFFFGLESKKTSAGARRRPASRAIPSNYLDTLAPFTQPSPDGACVCVSG